MKFRASFLLLLLSVASAQAQADPAAVQERDEIYMLTAYNVALKQWQETPTRGFNIAAIIVKNNRIYTYGLNSIYAKKQAIYHAEMDLALNYLGDEGAKRKNGVVNLSGTTVYTTLEPCMMCYATLRMLKADRVIYGQTDSNAGAASKQFSHDDNYQPKMPLIASASPLLAVLDHAYISAEAVHKISVTGWLGSKDARAIYAKAYCAMAAFKPRYPENSESLVAARKFLSALPGKIAVDCEGR